MNKLRLWARWSIQRSRNSAFVKRNWNEKVLNWIGGIVPILLFFCVGIIVYEFGFKPFWANNPAINATLHLLMIIVFLLVCIRVVLEVFVAKKRWARIFNVTGLLFVFLLAFVLMPAKANLADSNTNRFLIFKMIIYGGVLLGFITEISHFIQFFYSRSVNPGVVFIASFALLILLGTFLLKLPNASYTHTSSLTALFTATSAVCVTGLVVVDTATHFTPFGQVIILLLIQVGGLGIMTLAGLLAYAVAGNTSFKTQLAFTDIMSTRQVSNIMGFVYQVVFITFFFEAIGAFCIYITLDDTYFVRKLDKLFFSIFHSVSAFCNAGFSTYTNGLYENPVRFNYPLQIFIALQVVLGGMGFPIVFNLYKLIKIVAKNTANRLMGIHRKEYLPNVIILNSRLALVVSGVLLAIGFVAYMVFEWSATLMQHPTLGGKIATSFFGSVTPRTAGFNTVDLAQMSLPMIMIYLLLMWIGASPGSTGGGIKTTTAGVAILNMASILQGKDRTEFFRSEISFQSIRRAFAIIVISLLLIGIGVFCISVNDSEKGLINISFEAFSAFSTVGLSLGITAGLSAFSKVILIMLMFIGRVGAITLLVILIRQSKQLYYRYPKEDIAF